MSARRYAGVAERLRVWLGLEQGGWGLVISPPTEQRAIAAALHEAYPERPIVELDVDSTSEWFVPIVRASEAVPDQRPGAFVYLASHLDDDQRRRLLTMLNLQRDRTSDFGVWVLIASMREFELIRRHAGDLASVFGQHEVVKLEPRPMSEDEIRTARAELHAYYQRQFGRLDLRGFIRSEQEDVSFAVEEIFQPLRARMTNGSMTVWHWKPILVDQLAELQSGIALIVGAPGSGKSFFLRWCALAGSRDERFLGRERPIPVHVPLAVTRILIDLPSLEDYLVTSLLEAGLQIGHAIACEAAAGRVIFVLDGLDEAGGTRQRLVDGVRALAARYPEARVIVSSRPTGLDGVELDVPRFDLEGLDDDAVHTLLAKWCELYEVHRVGPDGAARGRAEGETLGREVIASPMLCELARFPLLATIIAIVHRAGVRLPDHRVELYEHIVRILVERWNDLRSRDAGTPPPSIRVPDAVRLLGPVAYEMVEGGRDGAIQEEALRDLIAKQLQRGTIRSVGSADEALAVFRNSLGLLVEQAPGVYSFLHKTLAEFLAAHEAVRAGTLERLLAADRCFWPKWREVILLSLGIVGTVQANDARLHAAVVRIVENARAIRGIHADDAPVLLGSIVANDPALSPELAALICEELVPAWWFDGAITINGLEVGHRILRGPWRTALAEGLLRRYGRGVGLRIGDDFSASFGGNLIRFLALAGAPLGPLLCELLVAELFGTGGEDSLWGTELSRGSELGEPDADGALTLTLPVHSGIPQLVRHGAGQLVWVGVQSHDDKTRFKPRSFELRGDDLVVLTRSESPERVAIEVVTPHRDERDALVPAVLAAWRELADQGVDGPQPPASLDEAIAKYGAPPDTTS